MNPAPAPILDLETRVRQGEGQISTVVDGEVMLLNIEQGAYFALADTGTRIWELIAQPRTVGELCTLLAAEFEVEPERCEADVLAFLDQVAKAGLIEIDT